MDRKFFFKALGGSFFTGIFLPRKSKAEISCEKTGSDVAGPFFRKRAPERLDLSLGAEGERIKISGTVTDGDKDCSPVEGANIDIWHASPEGEYDMDSEEYQFRGKIITDEKGYYEFFTVMPAGYRDGVLNRPRHIHYRVTSEGGKQLTTQLYFKGDERMKGDPFVENNDGYARAVELNVVNDDLKSVQFDIVF